MSGRGLIAVLVRGVTTDDLNSWPLCMSRSVFAARSFESATILSAALAVLLGLFFAFAIYKSFLILDYPTSADNLFASVENRGLAWGDGALGFVKNNAGG